MPTTYHKKWKKMGHVNLGAEKIVVRRRPGGFMFALSRLDEHGVEHHWVQMMAKDLEDLKNLCEKADSAR